MYKFFFDLFMINRYNHWLDKLADISLRQSAAYGVWNLSFNTLYHSTQAYNPWPFSQESIVKKVFFLVISAKPSEKIYRYKKKV